MKMKEDSIIILATFMMACLTVFIIACLTIPIWSDSERVCEYWEKQNNEMVCVRETTVFCLTGCDK